MHTHGPVHDHRTRVLWIALLANATFLVAEVIGGIAFNSLALLADAGHMLSDVAGLAIALVAQRLAVRPASARHSYGLQRAEVLGALANAITLLAVAGWIGYEAIQRLSAPPDVEGGGMLVVATLGLAVNIVSAVLLARAAGRSVNMRGAVVHMAVDAAGSAGAIAASVIILLGGTTLVDPLISLVLAALVVWSAWRLLAETLHVLLEGSPRHIDPSEVEQALASDLVVDDVHHVHLWSLASEVPALSAHVVLSEELSLHDAQMHGDRLRTLLATRFGIEHSTLELECHACEEPEHEGSLAS